MGNVRKKPSKVSDLELRKFYLVSFGYQKLRSEYMGSVRCPVAGDMAVFVAQDHNGRAYLPILFREFEIAEAVENLP